MTPAAASAPQVWTAQDLRDRESLYRQAAAEALEPTPEMRLSKWAEANIVLPPAEPVPGPLRFARATYQAGWLDLYTNRDVTEVTAVTSTQVGKSIGLIALIGYCVEHRRVPVLLVQAVKPTAKSFNRARVQPVFRASPALRHLLPKGRGATEFEIQMTNDVRVRFAGAGSPSDLAESSMAVVILDEFEKYPFRVGDASTDSIQAAKERTRWWNWSLVVKTTTPGSETGYGMRELARAPCQIRCYAPCPYCGARQILYFDGEKLVLKVGDREVSEPGPAGHVDWPKDKEGHPKHTPEEIKERRLAWYECGKCHRKWNEESKPEIIARGQWRTLDGRKIAGHVGLHLWAAYSPRLSWSDIAAEYLTTRHNPALAKGFCTDWLGRAFRQKGERPTLEVISTRRRESWRMGQVPEGARFLAGFCDVHKETEYWMVWAFGAGFTGWLVAAGREDVGVEGEAAWDKVFTALTRDYPLAAADGAGGSMAVGDGGGNVLMDSGWYKRQDGNPDENVNEAEVIERCDNWNSRLGRRLVHPSKGASRPMMPHLNFKGKTYDRTRKGKPLKNRLELHTFDPWFFKKDFYARLARPGEIGGLWLPADVPAIVMHQLMAEEVITRPDGREEWHARGPNHWFDCAVGCCVVAWRYRMYLEASVGAGGRRGKKVRLSDLQKGRG